MYEVIALSLAHGKYTKMLGAIILIIIMQPSCLLTTMPVIP